MRVCIAGVTGWTGSALAEAVMGAPDLTLTSGVSRSSAGVELANGAPVFADVAAALAGPIFDVLVDYTDPGVAAAHATAAIGHGRHVVIGTSGVSDAEFDRIDDLARRAGVGVVTAGNFSPLAAMLAVVATSIARFAPHREIVEYGSAGKSDAPGTTARDVARRMEAVPVPDLAVEVEATVGDPAARGSRHHGVQIHSVRLPSYTASVDVVLSAQNERLVVRYEPGSGTEPYVNGTLIAVREVSRLTGLRRGIEDFLVAAEASL